MYRTLNVWMNGEFIGTWRYGSVQSFLYNPEWVRSEAGRPLSLSMPFAGEHTEYRGAVVEAFFDNLLPDSVEMRKRIQSRFGTATIRPFDLLAEIGRDCVGAVQLLPEEQTPKNLKTIRGKILT